MKKLILILPLILISCQNQWLDDPKTIEFEGEVESEELNAYEVTMNDVESVVTNLRGKI